MARHGIGRRAVSSVIHGIGSRVAGLTTRGTGKTLAASAAIVITAVTLVCAPSAAPASATTQSTAHKHYEDIMTIFKGTNAIRKEAGKSAFKYDVRISIVSYDWSVAMGKAKLMSHNPRYSVQIPSGWLRAGENVAYACGYGDSSAEEIVKRWKASPGHYRNMVGDFSSIGIGVYWTGSCMYATQNFALYSKPPSYTLPVIGSLTSSLIKPDYSSKYTSQIAGAKSASASAEKHRSNAHAALVVAKKSRDKAKTYAASSKATATTKSRYASAAREYKLASADYSKAKSAAAQAKTYYSRVRSHAKAGNTASVAANLKYAKTRASTTSSARKKVVAHQKRVQSFTAAAKAAMRK